MLLRELINVNSGNQKEHTTPVHGKNAAFKANGTRGDHSILKGN
jgi:hypothetical protein